MKLHHSLCVLVISLFLEANLHASSSARNPFAQKKYSFTIPATRYKKERRFKNFIPGETQLIAYEGIPCSSDLPRGCRFILPGPRMAQEEGTVGPFDGFTFIDGVDEVKDAHKSDTQLDIEFKERERIRKKNCAEFLARETKEEKDLRTREEIKKEEDEKRKREQERMRKIQQARRQETRQAELKMKEILRVSKDLLHKLSSYLEGKSKLETPEKRYAFSFAQLGSIRTLRNRFQRLRRSDFIPKRFSEEAQILFNQIRETHDEDSFHVNMDVLRNHLGVLLSLEGKSSNDYRSEKQASVDLAMTRLEGLLDLSEEKEEDFKNLRSKIQDFDREDTFSKEMANLRALFRKLTEEGSKSLDKWKLAGVILKLRSVLNDLDPNLDSTQEKREEFTEYAETINEILYS